MKGKKEKGNRGNIYNQQWNDLCSSCVQWCIVHSG